MITNPNKNEVWAIIPGYNGKYSISSNGDVISKKGKTKRLNPTIWHNYYYIKLNKNNMHYKYRLHRLVAQIFIANPLNKPQVNHIDGVKSNNRADNLGWVTPQENANNAMLRNAYLKGEKHKLHKLSSVEVSKIRELFNSGVRQVVIANKFGVTRQNIGAILHGISWRHL